MNSKNSAYMLARAISFASAGLRLALDKAGEPVILHCVRVMQPFSSHKYMAAAVMHDLVEDGGIDGFSYFTSFKNLYDKDFFDVSKCVVALTRIKDEKYFDYIDRVCLNPMATVIKIADINDNLLIERMLKLDPKEVKSMTERYYKALDILQRAEDKYFTAGWYDGEGGYHNV